MPRYLLDHTQIIPRPLPEVFAFFSDAGNLELLTPAWLNFSILTPRPIPMAPGTLIDYQLRLSGIWFKWRTRIDEFEPGVRFVDSQIRGPYKSWHHEHRFDEVPEGTRMIDRVTYEMPLGLLGGIAHTLFVRNWLKQIFDFRAAVVEQELCSPNPHAAESCSGAHRLVR